MSVVCIYGIAPISIEGEHIFLEEDPEAFKAFVPTDKTHAYLIERGNEEQIFKEIAWKFLFVPVSYHTTGSSRELEIFAAFEEIRTGVHLVASDFSDFGKKVFANVVKNMECLPQSYDGTRWFGSFKNVPAIICAAGPSFAKNSAHLKTLTERALLIGGGSALNVLAHAGIVPHIAASIDPDPPHDRWEGQTALEIPFFYHHRVSSHLLAQVQGPTFWVKDAEAHPVEKWFYDDLQLKGPALEGGWNVATFSTALAAALGCNPIIFVGLDLRLEEGQLYAPGVTGERKEAPKDWEMAALWLEEFIQAHPEIQFINATEGGRGFIGALPLKLKDVPLDPQEDLRSRIAQLPKVSGPDAGSSVDALKKSLQHCHDIFEEHLAFPLSTTSSIEEEIAYVHILAPLWNIWQHVFARHVPPGTFESNLNKTLFLKNVSEQLLYEVCD
ncbi:MAG TPA: 6-hydroxymethylpterin diphosphokinase MptE-like protein [Rhabdochlamydiaceae bacterium]